MVLKEHLVVAMVRISIKFKTLGKKGSPLRSTDSKQKYVLDARWPTRPQCLKWSKIISNISQKKFLSYKKAYSCNPISNLFCFSQFQWNIAKDVSKDHVSEEGALPSFSISTLKLYIFIENQFKIWTENSLIST